MNLLAISGPKAARTAAIVLACVIALLAFSAAAQNINDGFDPEPDGSVTPIVVQPDGKTLIGGTFTHVGGVARNYVARLNPDGSLDTTFADPTAGPVGLYVLALAVQSDGKILVGGQFSQIAGQMRNCIARLNSNGTFDATFNDPAVNGYVTGIVLQTDGKILITGFFTQLGTSAQFNIARLNADGTRDQSFNAPALKSGEGGGGYILGLQPDGKILVAAPFSQIGGQTRHGLARLNADGTVDQTFGDTNSCCVAKIVVQPDGKILVGGGFAQIDGQTRNRVARLNANGTLDASFADTSIKDSYVDALALQPDGKVLAGGGFTLIGLQTFKRVARFNADGTLDATFANPAVDNDVYGVALQSDGKLVVGGVFAQAGGRTRNNLARLYPDGTLDATLNLPVDNFVDAVAMQPDDRILIGGAFTHVAGQPRKSVARLNADGTLDITFGDPGADDYVNSVALQTDGKILIGGNFTHVGLPLHNRVARLDANGALDDSFADSGVNGEVWNVAVQPDGKVLVAGHFGAPRAGVARLSGTDGTPDAAFQNPVASPAAVDCIALQPDGKILIGGDFTSVGGVPSHHAGRLNADGSFDVSFRDPQSDGTIYAIAVQPDGKILVGGSFVSIGGQAHGVGLARLNSDGTLDTSFELTGTNGIIYGFALQADGKILLAGYFTSVGGLSPDTRHSLARLNPDDTVDKTFGDLGANAQVYGLALQADGKVVVGGYFVSPRAYLARLSAVGVPQQSMSVGAGTVTWLRSGAAAEPALPPELSVSSDGLSYTSVGTMQLAPGGWQLPGFSPPFGLYYLRTNARLASAVSEGLLEATAPFYENDRIFSDGFE